MDINVGHTGNLSQRIKVHRADEVLSTAGSEPKMIWKSRPFQTRTEATSFEALLKSLRDKRHDYFKHYTDLEPLPFLTLQQRIHYKYKDSRAFQQRTPIQRQQQRRSESQEVDWWILILFFIPILAVTKCS